MLVHSDVALDAGDALLHPCRVVTVGFEIEFLVKFCGMTIRAVGVPIHTLTSPIPPFSRDAVFASKDIDPGIIEHIVSSANCLKFVTR